uniref:Glutathione peroxidase n=1 Tax=Piliocolobus tephrosceles TaxID=591936 RepID=A0A8C9H2Y4_9PRIM
VFYPVKVNGKDTHELFKFLKMHDDKGMLENIGWNFGKFLVDRNGNVFDYFSPKISPLKLEKKILQLL